MPSEKHTSEDAIDLDQIGLCQTFEELRQSSAFRQFIRLAYKTGGIFPATVKTDDETYLITYFTKHPSIWNAAEQFWRTEVKKEGTNLESFQAAQDISGHIRQLMAGALQSNKLKLAKGEDGGDIFDMNAHKERGDRFKLPEFGDPDDVVGLGNAEMRFDMSPAIREARQYREQDTGYTDMRPQVIAATKEWLRKAHSGWEVPDEEAIIPIRDALTGIQEAVKSFTGPRGRAVMCKPIYAGLPDHAVRGLKKKPVMIPLKDTGKQYEMDYNALEDTLREGDVFILCNPHNPTGHVYSRKELQRIKKICDAKNVKIIADEVHDGLCLDDEFVSIGSLYKGKKNNVATLLSTGKTFNLADQSCHMMVIPDKEMQEQFDRNRIQKLPPAAIPSRCAIAAFTQSDEWREELREYLRANRDYVQERIDAMPGMSVYRVQGGAQAWVDCGEAMDALRESGVELSQYNGPGDYLAKTANVWVGEGKGFHWDNKQHDLFRLNFAFPRSELEEMLDRIEKALQSESNAEAA